MVAEENKKNEEAIIRKLLDDWARALHDKNIEDTMSIYAPEVVSFDIVPPLQYRGADAFRKVWENVFQAFQGSITYELRDLSVTAGDDMAFAHSFNQLSSGQMRGPWVRWTACFRKINGRWLIVHHQVSVPVDLEHGKAVLDGQP